MTSHVMMGGMLQLYRRDNSRFWQCSASVGGKQRRASTKEDSLALAKQIAEDWYLELRGKARAGLLKSEKTFRQAAEQFHKEYEIITEGQRSPRWVEGHRGRLCLHLTPFFGDYGVSEVTAGKLQEYQVHRATTPPVGKLPRASRGQSLRHTPRFVIRNWRPHPSLQHTRLRRGAPFTTRSSPSGRC